MLSLLFSLSLLDNFYIYGKPNKPALLGAHLNAVYPLGPACNHFGLLRPFGHSGPFGISDPSYMIFWLVCIGCSSVEKMLQSSA